MEHPSAILRRHGLAPKKSWGQNFLGDEDVLEAIAQTAALQPDETCVELGAGLGHLTRALAASGARIVAVERDRDLAPVLRTELAPLENVTVVEADAARANFEALAQTKRAVVVGNLPYQIGAPVLMNMLDQRAHVSRAVFLLQREVAERLAAGPGTKIYGAPSALFQLLADVDLALDVDRSCFTPPPHVDSAVLRIVFLETPRAVVDFDRYRLVVNAAFGQRRKQLRSALRARANDLGDTDGALSRAGIDPTRRGETLSVEEFAKITNAL